MRRWVLILIAGFIFITGCKKYPEGGNSLFKKSKIRGEWKIESFTVDGADSLQYFLKSILPVCENYFSFEKKGKLILRCGNLENSDKNTWDINNKYFLMYISLWEPNVYLRTVTYDFVWDVIKLKNNEIWLVLSSYYEPFQKGKVYELRLKKL